MSLTVRGYGDLLTSFTTARIQYRATTACAHALKKAVFSVSRLLARLIGAFHGRNLLQTVVVKSGATIMIFAVKGK
jgi:hypothetical protein